MAKELDFMEVTAWKNGEGYDISVNEVMSSFTIGQIRAMKKLIKKLK